MIRKKLDGIKTKNPKDYKALLIAAHLYCENKDCEEPSEFVERNMLAVITDILDKYGVKYVDDISEVL